MCVAITVAAPGCVLAATDTYFRLGTRVHSFTGRTRRIPGGWCATSGSAAVVLRALRELEQAGVDGAERAIDTAVREVSFQREPGSDSRFMIAADDGELIEVRTDQPVWREPAKPSGFRYNFHPAPGLADGRAITATMLDAFGRAKSIEDVVRAVAGFIHDGHAQGGRQSDFIELGLTIGRHVRYLHRKAGWLASADDVEINLALSSPPVLPPFPELESERLIFRLVPSFGGA